MREAFETALARFEAWREKVAAAGFAASPSGDGEREAWRTAGGLFAAGSPRPLVVALFGGTGVGKSSLLNCLAGAPIARVGVVRPTSQELTAYVHESVRLADLPPEIAPKRLRIVRHAAPDSREILWIDTPDVDSTDESNRSLTLEILPRCDLVAYVVSPEKYADRRAWTVLRERGGRHGWIFVFNHWDAADPSQRAQFIDLLRGLGFEAPQVFTTCCAPGVAAPREEVTAPRGESTASRGQTSAPRDEFSALRATLDELLREHAVRELERLGLRARARDLCDAVDALLSAVGDGDKWRDLSAALERRWADARGEIEADAALLLRSAAAASPLLSTTVASAGQAVSELALKATGVPVQRPPTAEPHESGVDVLGALAAVRAALWDQRAASLLRAVIDHLEVAARHAGIAPRPLCEALEDAARSAADIVLERVDAAARRAVVAEGGPLRRGLVHALRVASFTLPLLAGFSVAGVAVWGFVRAAAGQQPYLGTDFLVHGAILVAVAWGLPYALYCWLRSSPRQEAIRGMRKGMSEGLEAVSARLGAALNAVREDAGNLRGEGTGIRKSLAEMIDGWQPIEGTVLRRVVTEANRLNAGL